MNAKWSEMPPGANFYAMLRRVAGFAEGKDRNGSFLWLSSPRQERRSYKLKSTDCDESMLVEKTAALDQFLR